MNHAIMMKLNGPTITLSGLGLETQQASYPDDAMAAEAFRSAITQAAAICGTLLVERKIEGFDIQAGQAAVE